MKAGQKGMVAGEMRAKQEIAYELCDMGFLVDKIAKAVKVSLETVKSWLSEKPSMAN